MLASDVDIDWLLRQRMLQVSPTEPDLIQPASIDLRLDNRFLLYAPLPQPELLLTDAVGPIIDPALEQPEMTYEIEIPDDQSYLLPSRGFALAGTLERIMVSRQLALKLEGKSSLGRLGLQVHATAGWIDPGFAGWLTLELFNAAPFPIRLRPGMKIAQLAVMALHSPAGRAYGNPGLDSHYQDQPRGPQPSGAFRTFRTWPTHELPAPEQETPACPNPPAQPAA